MCVCLPAVSSAQAESLQHRATSQFFAYFAENKLPRHKIKKRNGRQTERIRGAIYYDSHYYYYYYSISGVTKVSLRDVGGIYNSSIADHLLVMSPLCWLFMEMHFSSDFSDLSH